MSGPFRYKAFISYSWADRRATEQLFHRLENFHTPKSLVGAPTANGPAPRRLVPIFRDRDEEPAGYNLRDAIETALDESEFLIVVCSPNSVRSKWVTKEIAFFRKRRDPRNVIPYVIDGEPMMSSVPGREAEECFPEALRVETAIDGTPTGEAIEAPLAADCRPTGDGFKLAVLKVAAAMLGVGLDALVQRDAQRRARRMRVALGVVSAVALAMAGIALYAVQQRNEAQAQRVIAEEQRNEAQKQKGIAEKQRDTATSALNYLVSIYQLANPATENPKTITALTILERGAKKIDSDLKSEPEVQAKLFGALGSVYNNLGDVDQAEKLLRRAAAVPIASAEDRLDAELQLSFIDARRRKIKEAQVALDTIEQRLATPDVAARLNEAEINALKIRIGEQRAFIAYLSGDQSKAVELYSSVMALIGRDTPDADELTAKFSTNRGMILVSQKQFDKGRADLERARTIFLQKYGPNHLRTAQAIHNIAYEELEMKDYGRAIATMLNAMKIYRTVFEADHPDLANANKLYGTMLTAAGRPRQAIEPLLAAADGFAAAYGANYYDVGYSLVYLAAAYAAAGEPESGLEALDKAEKIYRKNFEPGGFDFGDLMVYRAMVLEKAGRKSEAAPLCAKGLDILKANLGEKDPYYIDMASKCSAMPA